MTIPMAVQQSQTPLHRRDTLCAAPLVAAAALATRALPFRTLVAMTTAVKRTTTRAASYQEAARIVAAIRAGAWLCPGRVACLELSLAATWLAAAHRRDVTWCIGVRTAPYASHAWIAVDGQPVGEAPGTDLSYHLLLTV